MNDTPDRRTLPAFIDLPIAYQASIRELYRDLPERLAKDGLDASVCRLRAGLFDAFEAYGPAERLRGKVTRQRVACGLEPYDYRAWRTAQEVRR